MVRTLDRMRIALLSGTVLLAVAAFVVGCQQRAPETGDKTAAHGEPAAAVTAAAGLERGHYLVEALGCGHCHTPMKMGAQGPEPDLTMLFAGHPESIVMPPAPQLPPGPWLWLGAATNTAFAGPWGVTYSTNLTPHETTGMGIWTEDMFIAAMKTGKHMGTSRPIQPPMPWQGYAQLTNEDLKAIYAYLRSVPPIANRVPDYQPPAGS